MSCHDTSFGALNADLQRRAAAFAAFATRFDAAPVDNSVAAYLRREKRAELCIDFLVQTAFMLPLTLRTDEPERAKLDETCRFALWFRGATADFELLYRCVPLSNFCGCKRCYKPARIENACVLLEAVLNNFVAEGETLAALGRFVEQVEQAARASERLERQRDDDDESVLIDALNRTFDRVKTASFDLLAVLCDQPCFLRDRQFVERGLGSLQIRPGYEEAAAANRPFALVRAPADEEVEQRRRAALLQAKRNAAKGKHQQ